MIALYLDEFHVSAGANTERVREALGRFVDEQLRPQDLVVVMKPLEHLTSDSVHARSRGAFARRSRASAAARASTSLGRRSKSSTSGRSPAAIRTARAQIVMAGVRALTTRMGELRGGLGGVVLVTEGFATTSREAVRRRMPDLQGLVRAASRAHVLVLRIRSRVRCRRRQPPMRRMTMPPVRMR